MTVVRNKSSDKESFHKIVDMSDVKTYGPEFHCLSFSKALELMPERMCDYRIIVMLMGRHHGNEGIEKSVNTAEIEDRKSNRKRTNSAIGARLAALIKTLHGGAEIVSIDGDTVQGTGQYVADISNCIVYCNTVMRSRWVRETLNVDEVNDWGFKQASSIRKRSEKANNLSNIPIEAGHLDAKSRSFVRFAELDSLRNAREKGIRKVLSNVGVLSEGIDVPALDSICFLEGRKSEIDIVQAVGRIMRKPSISNQDESTGKKFGYIIVPVMVDTQRDIFDQISSREDGWRILGQVLRALRAHDPRIETDLHERVIIGGGGNGNSGVGVSEGFLDRLRKGEYDQIITSVVASSGMNTEPTEVANLIESAVYRAASYLREENLEAHLEEQLGMQGQKSQSEKKTTDACTVAALILCNAMLMHQRIIQANSSRFQELVSVDAVRAHGTPEVVLTDAWKRILKEDYEPVFRQPLNLLESLHFAGWVPSGVRAAISTLAENAIDTAERYAQMGMDHAGPLFQKVMKNKAADGAFFTLPVAASLMAELVCDEVAAKDDLRWSAPETWEKESILDPTCGSGTLLMAMLTAVKRRARNLGVDEKTISAIHKSMVENGLTGLDINAQSIQIAACQQTIGDTSVNYQQMGLFQAPHGLLSGKSSLLVDENDVALGSLELFLGSKSNFVVQRKYVQQTVNYGQSEQFDQHTVQKMTQIQLSESIGDFKSEKLQDRLRRTSIVVCNPPYTNSAGRADKFTTAVKKAMQSREAMTKEYLEDHLTGKQIVDSSSIRTFFTPLIDQLLNKRTGIVGKVMPAIACSAASGVNERKFLAEKFHVSKLITLHAYGRFNWSTETDINESIVILNRKLDASKPTTFVALRKRPESESEAIELADRIRDKNLGDWGNSVDWPRERMLEGDWSPGMWFNFELAEVARLLKSEDQTLFKTPELWVNIGEYATVFSTGPSLRNKKKWLEVTEGDNANVPVCKSSGESVHLSILSEPETFYQAVESRNGYKDIANMRRKRSRLLLTERQATDSARLCAIAVKTLSVGSGWMPVGGVDDRTAKAWVVYLNSTLGRISLLSRRGKKLTYPRYAVEEQNKVYIPNLNSECSFDALLLAFEETKSMEVNQYRDGDCPARIIWDEAVAKVSGVPLSKIEYWRSLLNSEPSVLGNKAAPSK